MVLVMTKLLISNKITIYIDFMSQIYFWCSNNVSLQQILRYVTHYQSPKFNIDIYLTSDDGIKDTSVNFPPTITLPNRYQPI